MISYNINERLLMSVQTRNFEDVLNCVMNGASATHVSTSCGRTAVGTAALVGDVEILELLIQSCEEPESNIFQANSNTVEMVTTPDGMDNLEWEDEFMICNHEQINEASLNVEEDSSLYYYYAKTFERTGEFIARFDKENECDYQRSKPQDPHTIDALMMSPLHYAAACGHLPCVKTLLKHGAPIDAVDSNGLTPLHVGVEYIDVTRLLIKHGANLNLKTINAGKTALHLAIEKNCATVANLLLQTNVNINETDHHDRSPLISATDFSLDDVARILIQRGARVNLQDDDGFTALYYAVKHNNVSLAALLLEHGARRITNHYLLHHCVVFNMFEMAKLLVEWGDNLAVRNRDGYTPILLAICSQKLDLLEYLLRKSKAYKLHGRLFECSDNELLFAVQTIDSVAEFKPIARTLFMYSKSSRNALYTSGQQPLTCCMLYCQTPLSRAINLQKLDIAEFLLKEGCNTMQICGEHVLNNLRSMSCARSIIFCKLLTQIGFSFPSSRKQVTNIRWSSERKVFEQHMSQIASEPLSLQALSRLIIRRCLLHKLQYSDELQLKYPATQKQSTFLQIVQSEIELPEILKSYLVNFDEIPTCSSVQNCE